MVGLFVLAAGLWLLHRRAVPAAGGPGSHARPGVARPVPRALLMVIAVVSVAVAVGSVVQVVRIGESGAKAVWSNSFSTTAQPDHTG